MPAGGQARLLAISGSARAASTNTALLQGLRELAPEGISVELLPAVDRLPVFSPDREGAGTPPEITRLLALIEPADGIVIASPEYVHAIPGGLKNLIDWLVSREVVIGKPIAIAHASHRGDDMLSSLRLVLGTISSAFAEDIFIRIPLMAKTPEEIGEILKTPENVAMIRTFLSEFADYCSSSTNSR